MDQKEKEDNKEQEQTPGSSYKVHFDETKGPAFLGDNCKYYQDQRNFVVVQVYPGSGAYFQKLDRLRLKLNKFKRRSSLRDNFISCEE